MKILIWNIRPTMMMVGNGRLLVLLELNKVFHIVRVRFVLLFALLGGMSLSAQECLYPVIHSSSQMSKSADEVMTLPFFDDFSNSALSQRQWIHKGSFVNQGYGQLPPTVGMVTFDAYNDEGDLYATTVGQLFAADTMTSLPIRLDSIFHPFPKKITPSDSVYFSFFYLPGGGYGNRWELLGDVPELQDSLKLEFFIPDSNKWECVWSRGGCSADSLYAQTGSYWQYQEVAITDLKYFTAQFQFRFRNYCSMDMESKKGILGNADQWSIDYISLDVNRKQGDSICRDLAFVNPAPSLLKSYQAMPYRQFSASELSDTLSLTITNRFEEQLATNYGYQIYDEQGTLLYHYDGGFENVPVYWDNHQYQSSQAHATPPVEYILPISSDEPSRYSIVHGIREGVSGDLHLQNDTVVFEQIFDDYYAYDDGTPENGYGVTSTFSRVRIACQFPLNVEDTLTALALYFNHTLANQNGDIRFLITVWDDADGMPSSIIYQDHNRRKPQFDGLNKYVKYVLEEPVVCSGTIYVGLEQTSADFLNLGFDRNNDASSHIFYFSGSNWQTSILRGALMLRPYFGHKAAVGISNLDTPSFSVFAQPGTIVVETELPEPVVVYNTFGQVVATSITPAMGHIVFSNLRKGLYLIRQGSLPAKKVIVYE